MKQEDLKHLERLSKYEWYQPEKQIPIIYDQFRKNLRQVTKQKPIEVFLIHQLWMLSDCLSTHYFLNGMVEKDALKIQKGSFFRGRIKFLSSVFQRKIYYGTVNDSTIHIWDMTFNMFINDHSGLESAFNFFNTNSNSHHIQNRMVEDSLRAIFKNEKSNYLNLEIHTKHSKTKYYEAINKLIRSMLLSNQSNFEKAAEEMIKRYYQWASSNSMSIEKCFPFQPLGFINFGCKYADMEPPDLSQFKSFAFSDLNSFLQIEYSAFEKENYENSWEEVFNVTRNLPDDIEADLFLNEYLTSVKFLDYIQDFFDIFK